MCSQLIEDYEFGEIKINGKVYTNDVILLNIKIVPIWWRNDGHTLKKQDLERIIDYRPELLIIGKGAYGNMTLSKNLKIELNFNIEEYEMDKAVLIYNDKIKDQKKVAGAFHLTC